VFWRKPMQEGESKLSPLNHGPYVITKRTTSAAEIRHLHTGEYHPYAVNLSQLFVAKDYQTPPDEENTSVNALLYSKNNTYRAHDNVE